MPGTMSVVGFGETICQKYYHVQEYSQFPRQVDVVHAPNDGKCIIKLHHMARRVPYHGEGRRSKNDNGVASMVCENGGDHRIVVWERSQHEQGGYHSMGTYRVLNTGRKLVLDDPLVVLVELGRMRLFEIKVAAVVLGRPVQPAKHLATLACRASNVRLFLTRIAGFHCIPGIRKYNSESDFFILQQNT